jgi:hypothetical protein
MINPLPFREEYTAHGGRKGLIDGQWNRSKPMEDIRTDLLQNALQQEFVNHAPS